MRTDSIAICRAGHRGFWGPLKAPRSSGINGAKSCILGLSWHFNFIIETSFFCTIFLIYFFYIFLITYITIQASTLTYFSTCPFGQLTKKSTCPTQSFSCPKKLIKITKTRIIIQGSHYFQIKGRSDFSFRELTGRSGKTSGRSQLRLIETLFRDP